jgi:hypothetical protein
LESWDVRTLEIRPHFPQVLQSADHGRAIALDLPAGEELQEHQTHEAAYLVVVDGRVEVSPPGGEATTGGPGFLAFFRPTERREVRARETSRLLLVLTPWPGEGHYT